MSTPFQFRPGPPALALTTSERTFERKVGLSKLALVMEAAWPRLWLLAGLALVFVALSLLGLWPALPEATHKFVLAAFAVSALVVLLSLLRIGAPTRAAAIRRLEQRSGVPHRPASAYEDTVAAASDDPVASHIWSAHKARLATAIARLRVGAPSPRADAHDPFALRALALLGVVTLLALVGDAASDRLAAAFRFGPLAKTAGARLDAWVTPPTYTNAAPIMLADGARGLAGLKLQGSDPTVVPANSVLFVRATAEIPELALEVLPDTLPGGQPTKPQRIEAPKAPEGAATPVDSGELKAQLPSSGTVRVLSGGRELVKWAFTVTPDNPPKVSFTREPERTLHGALRIPYKVEDDYGVASLEGHIARLRTPADTSANAWARAAKIKGPRPPYEHPPQLVVRMPQSYPKSATGVSLHEIGDSVWAGMPVTLTLIAKDSANQAGLSDARKMVLPARQFYKPLARAVVEQRRDLFDDPRQLPHVLAALDAITLAPEKGVPDLSVYLELRSVYWRLGNDHSRPSRNSAIAQLWQIALRIEDGALSDAERALKDAQDKLSKALEDGASDEELAQLMGELRQAMSKFLDQLSKQAQNQPPSDMQGQEQTMTSSDLARMLDNLENMTRMHSKDQAQQALNDLRDLLDRLQSGRMAQGQGQGGGQSPGSKEMGQLGQLLGKEQQLTDDTFREQRNGDDQSDGQQGQGQGNKKGGQNGQNKGQGLAKRQQDLHDMLEGLQRGLAQQGMKAPDQLGDAGKAMQDAEKALRDGDLQGGSEAEQKALDALRKGARELAEQIMKNNGQRMGRAGQRGPMDPLGRPQSTMDGFDPGTGVKVPDQIDVQRAREILDELRRRMGEGSRPAFELDYLERLLKQF